MKKTILSIAAACLALAGITLAGPAADIAAKHAAASATELEAYLKENPEAKDKSEAIDLLLSAYELTGNSKGSAKLLQARFDALPSGAEIDPQQLYQTTQSLFDALAKAGDKEGAKKLIATAIEKCKGHQAGEQLKRAFAGMEGSLNTPQIGQPMEIKFTSIQGEEIDLAKMTGKVVLVDFWATWCGPCIRELPNVQKTYDKYHDKGFEIIAISLDQDKGKLTKFIDEKMMPWPQYFDGKGWGNEISTGFGIRSIPATFLIGTDGKVAATDLRGGALERAVAAQLEK